MSQRHINNLPVEILNEIFKELVEEKQYLDLGTGLLHSVALDQVMGEETYPRRKIAAHSPVLVCRQWRTIIDCLGQSWRTDLYLTLHHRTRTSAEQNVTLCQTGMQKSRGADLFLNLDGHLGVILPTVFEVYEGYLSQLAATYSHQIAAIQVSVNEASPPLRLMQALHRLLSGSLHRLRVFKFITDFERPESLQNDQDSLTGFNIPSLRYLDLSYWRDFASEGAPANLRVMRLQLSIVCQDNWIMLHQFLQQTPQLDELSLTIAKDSLAPSFKIERGFLPKKLTKLALHANLSSFAAILGSSELTKLAYCNFGIGDATPGHSPATSWNPPRLRSIREVTISFQHWSHLVESLLDLSLPKDCGHVTLTMTPKTSPVQRNGFTGPKIHLPVIEILHLCCQFSDTDYDVVLGRLDLSRLHTLRVSCPGLFTRVFENWDMQGTSISIPSLRHLETAIFHMHDVDVLLRRIDAPLLESFIQSETDRESYWNGGIILGMDSYNISVRSAAQIVSIIVSPTGNDLEHHNPILLFPDARRMTIRVRHRVHPSRLGDLAMSKLLEILKSGEEYLPHLRKLDLCFEPGVPYTDSLAYCKQTMRGIIRWRLRHGLPGLSCQFTSIEPGMEKFAWLLDAAEEGGFLSRAIGGIRSLTRRLSAIQIAAGNLFV